MTPRTGALRYLLGARFYGLSWTEWGDPAAPPVLCVHALTGTGRYFDDLAQALAADFRVICPDLPGRGASEPLADHNLYVVPSYVAALAHLLAVIGQPVGYVGTSLGGLCGMAIAAAEGQPILRMVLNDIGPFIPKAALARIRDYIGSRLEFDDMAALEAYLRAVHAPFGRLTDAQWAHLATHAVRPLPDGRVALHYDPGIAQQVRDTEPQDVDLWAFWARITIPMLALRGESSDLLLPETFARMGETGAATHIVRECGHAPALMDAETIGVVRGFLMADLGK